MSTSDERDQSIERLLRQSLKAPRRAGPAESCLDAETVAAWVDGGLSGAALAMAQAHVADCDRCQSLVGAMARANVALPQPEHERAPRRRLAWLVPLTAAAAAVALWVAVPRDKDVSVAPPPSVTDTPAPLARPDARQPAPPARPQAPQADAPTERRDASSTLNRQTPAREPAPELRKDAGRLEADAVKEEAKAATAAPAAAAPVAPPPATARAAVAGAIAADRAQSANGFAPACTPGWSAAPTDVAAQLTAAAAPSPSVCWLVGRHGVVIVSIDQGRTWRRATSPEITDLSAVQATDARTASVTTADGRMFSTSDGGMTWIRP